MIYFNDLNSSQLLYFTYLTILLAFLLSGFLLSNTIKGSTLIKQILAWLSIFLLIIVIYSFRYDFYDLKNKVKSEIFPSKIVQEGENKILITASKDSHFYVTIKVNDIPIRFMIDTGASDIVLSKSDAIKADIDLRKIKYFKNYQTANGIIVSGITRVKKISVTNDIIFYDMSVAVNENNMSTSLLGMDFLRKFRKYEFYQDRLILTY